MPNWTTPAAPSAVRLLRGHAVAYAAAAGAPAEVSEAIGLAVSETVTNAVLHAYDGMRPGDVRLTCFEQHGRIVVEVADDGAGMTHRTDSPGLGHGLAIVGGLAQSLEITRPPGGSGTVVRMAFGAATVATDVPDLAPLCALALEQVADASCVDVVGDGVLRRVAAEVAGDPDLGAWLRRAIPPAKPGTATWAALRERGVRLVVHDPAVPRSPGGPGERLGLTWWLAVPLDGHEALWGMGGREGGRPVPAEAVIRRLSDAGRARLA